MQMHCKRRVNYATSFILTSISGTLKRTGVLLPTIGRRDMPEGALARSLRRIVALGDPSTIAGLGRQLERRLEEVHEQPRGETGRLQLRTNIPAHPLVWLALRLFESRELLL